MGFAKVVHFVALRFSIQMGEQKKNIILTQTNIIFVIAGIKYKWTLLIFLAQFSPFLRIIFRRWFKFAEKSVKRIRIDKITS